MQTVPGSALGRGEKNISMNLLLSVTIERIELDKPMKVNSVSETELLPSILSALLVLPAFIGALWESGKEQHRRGDGPRPLTFQAISWGYIVVS